jgi:4-amino-4-deoxychorismate lyase
MLRLCEPMADTGIFETLAVVDQRPRLLERHLARLAEGCRRLGLFPPSEAALTAEICAQADAAGAGVIKVIITESAAKDDGRRAWSVRAEPPRQRPLEWARDGVGVITCRTRLPLQPELAGLKLLDRTAQVQARREWTQESIAEGLMLDAEGRLISGTMTNVFAVIDRVVCTPAIVRCGVAGVMRGALVDAWQASGQATIVRDLDPAELKGASEIFLSNALIGVWPVRVLDGQEFGVGPVTRAAREWTGRVP